MSNRAGYSDDLDPDQLAMWRGQVASAIRGKRGQRLIRDLKEALEKLPEKALITEELQDAEGDVCALGAVGLLRGIDIAALDPEDWDGLAEAFDIAEQLAREIMYTNDEAWHGEKPEQRWERMMHWAEEHLKPETSAVKETEPNT